MHFDCSPDLRITVDRSIELFRRTFPTLHESDISCEFNALLVLAGLGNARLESAPDGRPVWVRTFEVADNVVPFIKKQMRRVGHDDMGDIKLSELVRCAIDKIVEDARLIAVDESGANNITSALALLCLAGQGHAKIVRDQKGELMWAAGIDLSRNFKSITSALASTHADNSSKTNGKNTEPNDGAPDKIRCDISMDPLLREVAGCWAKLARVQFQDLQVDDDILIMGALKAMEICGDAIVCVGPDGEVTWKASEQLIREYADDDENYGGGDDDEK